MRTIAAGLVLGLMAMGAQAGVLDPDCTAEKAARSAAAKATVGVGGRCDMKEAVKDTTNDALGLDEKKEGIEDAKDKIDDAIPGDDHKHDGKHDDRPELPTIKVKDTP